MLPFPRRVLYAREFGFMSLHGYSQREAGMRTRYRRRQPPPLRARLRCDWNVPGAPTMITSKADPIREHSRKTYSHKYCTRRHRFGFLNTQSIVVLLGQ